MKVFNIERQDDKTGLSGLGVVAQGVEFDDGTCVVRWMGKIKTTVMHDNMESIITI